MFFNSVKEINRLRKEIYRLLSERMSNTYFKVAIEKKWGNQILDFSKFKNFVSRSVFEELQLTQTMSGFFIIFILKEIMRF